MSRTLRLACRVLKKIRAILGPLSDGFNSMSWRCPACQTVIRYSDFEERRLSGRTYRCHICRLDLALDEETRTLTVAPFRDDYDPRLKPTK